MTTYSPSCTCQRKNYSLIHHHKNQNQCQSFPRNAPERSRFNCRKMPVRPAFTAGQAKYCGELFRFPMSVLFFKRFLKRPLQIASIVPSSKVLVERGAHLSSTRSPTNSVSMRLISRAPIRNTSCKTSRPCLSRFFARTVCATATARSTGRVAFLRRRRDENDQNAHRKRFDGRDGGAG